MAQPQLKIGTWRAWLDSPGGDLPFMLEVSGTAHKPRVRIVNGRERIDVPQILSRGEEIVFDINHYDATIKATVSENGTRLDGEWDKRSKNGKWSKLAFHADAGAAPRFLPPNGSSKRKSTEAPIDGRWSVMFSGSDEPAVGIFQSNKDGSVFGTFLTATGDYRYLAGDYTNKRLRLSCFDGAHAFLFDARLRNDGSLKGDFWSRDAWHESWTAHRDENATVPDAFEQTVPAGRGMIRDLAFTDMEGKSKSLNNPEFAGNVRIIEVFGTWCPNCHDASELLSELDMKYRTKGLSIVGIAFELTGDFEHDRRQVQRFAKRHKTRYPILLGGIADKEVTSEAIPFVDRIRSYPTTIFADRTGQIRYVHSGFAGPATGEEHQKLRAKFEAIIEKLLEESRQDED